METTGYRPGQLAPTPAAAGAAGVKTAHKAKDTSFGGKLHELIPWASPFSTQEIEGAEGAVDPGKLASGALEGIAKPIGQLIETYGVRLLEIVAGGALVIFGLATLARGARE